MWKLAKRSWGLLATLATMIYWFSTNSLETTVSEADSYLFKNLKYLGWENPPEALATTTADNIGVVVSILLAALAILSLGLWVWDRLRKRGRPVADNQDDKGRPKRIGIRVSGDGNRFNNVNTVGADLGFDVMGNQNEFTNSTAFDRLLEAMVHGDKPTSQTKSSEPKSSSPDDDDDCDETRTRPDTSEDACD